MAKILVVDDDAQMVEMLRSMLELNGHSVEQADDGHSALVRLGADGAPSRDTRSGTAGKENVPPAAALPDVVVLDLVMSKLDGFTVASRLHGHADTKALPIVILTGKGVQMKHFFKDLPNVRGFLEKPFELSELLELVRQLAPKK